MQTFLPYPDFGASAECLDKRRCWKQVIEATQIIKLLETQPPGWDRHPAVRMWTGHVPELKYYFNTFLITAINKHHIRVKAYKPIEILRYEPRSRIHDSVVLEMPWWVGNKNFHRAMRARLIEKYPEFYRPLWPDDEGFNGGKYFWPVMETKTFRVI